MAGHLDNVEGILKPTTITKLRGLIDRGYKTAQEFMDPEPVVRISREPAGGGPPVFQAEFTAILVKFGVREVTDTSLGPIVTKSSTGTLHHEATEFDLKVGDIVTYEGRASRVTATYPPAFGVVISELDLIQ